MVNTAIASLNNISQQNAGISEQLASSAEELAAGAQELERVISYFKTDTNEMIAEVQIPIIDYKIKEENTIPPVPEVKSTKKYDSPGIMLDLGKEDIKDTDFESF